MRASTSLCLRSRMPDSPQQSALTARYLTASHWSLPVTCFTTWCPSFLSLQSFQPQVQTYRACSLYQPSPIHDLKFTVKIWWPPHAPLGLQVEGAFVEVETRARDMMDRTKAMGWATTEADAPLRGIDRAEVAEVGSALILLTHQISLGSLPHVFVCG